MCVLALWQVLDGGDEFESLWEELGGSGEHQLVGLSDRHVSHAGDVGDLFLGTLVARRLKKDTKIVSPQKGTILEPELFPGLERQSLSSLD